MRFMIIVKATKDSEAGLMPSADGNQDLIDAGIFVAADGSPGKFEGRARRIVRTRSHRHHGGHSRKPRTWLPVIGSGM